LPEAAQNQNLNLFMQIKQNPNADGINDGCEHGIASQENKEG
jgi:hypothetical protein